MPLSTRTYSEGRANGAQPAECSDLFTSDGQRLAIEAWRRGIPLRLIAQSLGITTQAVSDRIRRYEKRTGQKIIRTRRVVLTRQPKILWRCKSCGKEKWSIKSEIREFCSQKCAHDATREIPEEKIIAAIRMRNAGQTWLGAAKVLRCHSNAIQRRVWMLLHERGLLTTEIVGRLWRPVAQLHRRSYSCQWLIAKTGLTPREDFFDDEEHKKEATERFSALSSLTNPRVGTV